MSALPEHLQERIWRVYYSENVLTELVRATRLECTLRVSPCEFSYNDMILGDLAFRGPVEAKAVMAPDWSLVGGQDDVLLSLPCPRASGWPPACDIDVVCGGEVVFSIPDCDVETEDVPGEEAWTCAWYDPCDQKERFYKIRVQRLVGMQFGFI